MSDDNKFRVWVGCLACYNEGRLVGEWFDAEDCPQDEDEFNEKVPGHKKIRQLNPHEELWVFDHENSPRDGEFSPMDAQQWAEWLSELPEGQMDIFRQWMKHESREFDEEAVEDFQERYAGCFGEGADAIEELYPESELPEWAKGNYWMILRNKFSDLVDEGAYYTIETGYEEVHIFRSY